MIIKFLVGVCASGKSTFAKEIVKANDNYIRVNKDDIREQCMCGKWSKELEQTVKLIRNTIIENALRAGKNVIVDDTNLQGMHYKTITKIAHKIANETGQPITISKQTFHISKEEAIERDMNRQHGVGVDVINRMYKDYERVKDHADTNVIINPLVSEEDKVIYNPDLPSTIICDLDGTLCLFTGNPYDRDFSKDSCNEAVRTIIHSWYRSEYIGGEGIKDVQITFFSGRDNKFREVTNNWIKKYLSFIPPEHYSLYMRPENDSRPDTIVKKEMFDIIIRDRYNVDFVLDDRKKICEMWFNMKIPVFRFGNPNLDF